MEANKGFMEAFSSGDAGAVSLHYTSNALLYPSNSDIINGRNAIKEFWSGTMRQGIGKAVLETVAAEGYGDVVIEEGRYTLYAGDQMVDKGKYIVIWEKEDGVWKLQRDIWNTSMPAPPSRSSMNDTVWVVWNHINADKVSQFEEFNFNILEPAVAEYYPLMRSTVRSLRPVEPNKNGIYTYFYLMDPATSPDGYAMTLALTAKYGKEKSDEYMKMLALF
ncbi:MAG: DUF4440 domain-containing protein [Bacteroidales bacterium]|nr:DUF4440 domain-containing protein [Bacteroidales bacterium]